MDTKERGSFKGSLGFVLAAAGSAVGLGNIWRFPTLAAKDGGGLFLVVYIVLALSFGFALLTTEISIGRKTKQSPLTAYSNLMNKPNSLWGSLGILSCIVPFLILPYYCAIGGWVLKYFVVFLTGHGTDAAADGYFGGFISGPVEPVVYMAVFLIACAVIIYMGVNKGIENSSKILMPVLLVMVIGIAVFSLTLKHTDENGITTTGIDGLKVYLVPSLEGVTVRSFFGVVMDALGQLFFSLSVAMGILITYGSYVPDNTNLIKSINQIEFFDTLVAFLAGVMIVPAVYVFMGTEGMASGPSLIFESLPIVFTSMGKAGNIIGALFFAMVLFAALTSAVSILEAVVSSIIDRFGISRRNATLMESGIALVIGVIVCFGYNIIDVTIPLPGGSEGTILDALDYATNYILMPIIAISTCILAGWVLKPDVITGELTKNGERFARKGLYVVMVKYVAPVFILFLMLVSQGIIKF